MKNTAIYSAFVQKCVCSGKLKILDAAAMRSLDVHTRRQYVAARRRHSERAKSRLEGGWPHRASILVPLGEQGRDLALSLAKAAYPKRRNWESPVPGKTSEVKDKNHGNYSSRCTFTRWSYVPALKSFALVSRWGGQALVYHHHDGKRFVKAPRGWRWHQDDNGLRLISRSSPTDDFHPNSDDLLKGTGYLLKRAVALRQTRRAEAARSRREINLLVGHAPGVRVCLQDSLNAGNCETGTLEFARRHGLDPEFYYTPTKLLKLEPGNQRVKLAIAFAARRHAQLAATGITVRYPKARRQRRP